MNALTTVALRFDRHDGAHGFDDPAVPAGWTIDQLLERVAPKLRYPTTDVSTGKPLRYAMLRDGVEVPREETVGRAFPERRGRAHVVHEYANAGRR
jgi:hypothetical protein